MCVIQKTGFVNMSKISPIQVTLPNGSLMETNSSGRVKLINELIVENVLFVPEFTVNLISMAKLCMEQDCTLIFKPGICIIHEESVMRKIGLAK